MCIFPNKKISKLIDDISDDVTKNAIQNSDYFNSLKKALKMIYVSLLLRFLYNDSRKAEGKRWFYNEIFLYNDFSKENKKKWYGRIKERKSQSKYKAKQKEK